MLVPYWSGGLSFIILLLASGSHPDLPQGSSTVLSVVTACHVVWFRHLNIQSLACLGDPCHFLS